MRHEQVLRLWVNVDRGVMAMKGIVAVAPETEVLPLDAV